MMVLNGPIVKRLGVNSGQCALGPGAASAVNTVLGRALRLIYMNLGHAYPGVFDLDTLGSPNKYSMCLGENEEASPWQPYHVEKGYERDASVVTVFTTYAISEVEDGTGTTPEAVLNVACTSACNMGPKSVGFWLLGGRTDPHAAGHVQDKHLLLVCPVHARSSRSTDGANRTSGITCTRTHASHLGLLWPGRPPPLFARRTPSFNGCGNLHRHSFQSWKRRNALKLWLLAVPAGRAAYIPMARRSR